MSEHSRSNRKQENSWLLRDRISHIYYIFAIFWCSIFSTILIKKYVSIINIQKLEFLKFLETFYSS